MSIYKYSIAQLSQKLLKRELTSLEVVQSVLSRIHNVDDQVNGYISTFGEEAVERARQIDNKIQNRIPVGRLAGIPIAIKDNISIKNRITTCASKMLSQYRPPYNATIIEKLLKEDAIIIGKTNMDEFAMGSSTETSYFGTVRNPWNLDTVPGGTSGGAAAVLAADETIGSIGSDTGGSVRQPASFCSVSAIKPTYGRISRYGLIAYASSLDTIAPLGKDVRDCALLLSILSGKDSRDSTSAQVEVPDYEQLMTGSIRNAKIGLPKEFFSEGIRADVKDAILNGVKVYESLGISIEETSLPTLKYGIPSYYLIATSEVSSNLARYMGIFYGHRASHHDNLIDFLKTNRTEGFGSEARRRIILGTYALSSGYYDEYYLKAQKIRTLIMKDYLRAFEKYDVLIGPASPFPAFRVGEKINDPLQMYLADIYTITINMAGIPAMCIPCGFSVEGLPIGMQIIGKHFDEARLLQFAYTFEENTDIHLRKPSI